MKPGPAEIYSYIQNPAAANEQYFLDITGPENANQEDLVGISLGSSASDKSAPAQGFLAYVDTGGGDNTTAFWDYSGLTIYVAQLITAVKPGTGTSPADPAQVETWHTITLDSGWSAGSITPAYRLLPDGNLQLTGQATRSGIAGSANVNNSNPLPAAYRPPGTVNFYAYETAFNRAHMTINSAGVITASSSGTVTGTWYAELNAVIPLTS